MTSMYEAIEIYKLAEKFGATDLSEICKNYATENVNNSNVLETYEFADKNNLDNHKAQCSEIIKANTLEVLKSSRWKLEWIKQVLDEPELNIKEIDLFKIVESWVNTYYSDEENSGYRTVIWQTLVPRFCFLSMTADEFMGGPSKTGIITKEESLAVLGHIIKGEQSHLPYPSNLKNIKRLQYTKSVIPAATKPPAEPEPALEPTAEPEPEAETEPETEPETELATQRSKPSILKTETTKTGASADDLQSLNNKRTKSVMLVVSDDADTVIETYKDTKEKQEENRKISDSDLDMKKKDF